MSSIMTRFKYWYLQRNVKMVTGRHFTLKKMFKETVCISPASKVCENIQSHETFIKLEIFYDK